MAPPALAALQILQQRSTSKRTVLTLKTRTHFSTFRISKESLEALQESEENPISRVDLYHPSYIFSGSYFAQLLRVAELLAQTLSVLLQRRKKGNDAQCRSQRRAAGCTGARALLSCRGRFICTLSSLRGLREKAGGATLDFTCI